MALPPAGTVPTTDARASVEIESPALDAVDPADVDSGADIARRASGLAAVDTRAVTEAELERAMDGNATAIAALETYYRDPVVAADRLSELSPAERDELRAGNLEVLGETRERTATETADRDLGRDEIGAGLAVYAANRAEYATAYDVAETREIDRATGREPDLERDASPNTDLEPGRDPGQAPSRGGLGGFMEGMRNAEQSAGSGGGRAERTPEEMLTQQTVAMRPNL